MPKKLLLLLFGASPHLASSAGMHASGAPSPPACAIPDSAPADSCQGVADRPPLTAYASGLSYGVDKDFFTNLPARGIDPAILIQPGVMSLGTNAFGEPLVSVRGGREGELEFSAES